MNRSATPDVQTFLAAVEREASALPAQRRQELLADLAEHIDVALAERPGQERQILAELGDPRTIAATALETADGLPKAPAPSPSPPRTPGTVRALRVLLWVLVAVAALVVIGIASGQYAGTPWLQAVTALPAILNAAHVFFLRPGRSIVRVTLSVTLGLYFLLAVLQIVRGHNAAILGLFMAAANLVLLHQPATRRWLTGRA